MNNINQILKWSIIAGLFLVPFTPLMIYSSLLFPFITGKAIFFKSIVGIVFALYLILVSIDQEYRPKKSWLSLVVTIFLVIVFIADIFGINPHKSFWSNFERMEGFFLILHLWMFYIVASAMLVKKHWNYFLGTSIGASLIVSWYGLFQIAGKIDIRQGATRLDSTLGNASYFAVYVLLNLGFALYLYLQRKDHKPIAHYVKMDYLWLAIATLFGLFFALGVFPYMAAHFPIPTQQAVKHTSLLLSISFWMALGGALVYGVGQIISILSKTNKYNHFLYLVTIVFLQLYLIFKSATRGTMLGIAVALVVTSVIYVWKGKSDKVGRYIAIAILALVVLSSASLLIGKNSSFVKNNDVLNRVASISFDNARTKYIWPIAWEGIKDRPILGYGQEGFNYVFNTYYNSKMWTEESWFDRAHNVFIDWFISAGVLGFGVYVALYVLAALSIWKGDFNLKEKTVLIGLLIAYAVHNMTVFDNISSYILFFALLAFLQTHNAKKHIEKISINADIRDLVIIPSIVIGMLTLTYYVNYLPVKVGKLTIDGIRQYAKGPLENLEKYKKAMSYNVTGSQEVREQTIQTSEQVIRNSKDENIQQAFFTLSSQAVKDQIAYAPKDARGYLLGGSYLNRIGQLNVALPILQKAHELTPNKQTPLFEIAQNYLNTNKYIEAVDSAKKAFELDPNFQEAHRFYMITLLYADKYTELNEFVAKYPPSIIDENLIKLFVEKKQTQIIVKIYEQLIKNRPNDVQLRGSLAAAYFVNGNRALSIKTLEQAIIDFPEFKEQGNKLISDIYSGKNPIQK